MTLNEICLETDMKDDERLAKNLDEFLLILLENFSQRYSLEERLSILSSKMDVVFKSFIEDCFLVKMGENGNDENETIERMTASKEAFSAEMTEKDDKQQKIQKKLLNQLKYHFSDHQKHVAMIEIISAFYKKKILLEIHEYPILTLDDFDMKNGKFWTAPESDTKTTSKKDTPGSSEANTSKIQASSSRISSVTGVQARRSKRDKKTFNFMSLFQEPSSHGEENKAEKK